MQYALLVELREPQSKLLHDAGRLFFVKGAFFEALFEITTFDELHRVVRLPRLAEACAVNSNNIGVIDRSNDLQLSFESRQVGLGKVARHDLDGMVLLEQRMPAQVDLAHRAFTELLLDFVGTDICHAVCLLSEKQS